jgi:hypothetical protein
MRVMWPPQDGAGQNAADELCRAAAARQDAG